MADRMSIMMARSALALTLVISLTAITEPLAAQMTATTGPGTVIYPPKPPAPQPQAIPSMHVQGLLPHQADRDASEAAQRDFSYMRSLAFYYRRTRNRAALARLQLYLDAWTTIYQPSFRPIDETRLDGLIDAYVLTSNELPRLTQDHVRAFLRRLANGYLLSIGAHAHDPQDIWYNNQQSHRIKLITMSAAALNDDRLFAQARAQFIRQLNSNMYSDGKVRDFLDRDALYYVVYDLEPLTRTVLAARARAEDWTQLKGDKGQSLYTGLDWLLPYAQGTRTHDEFAHTRVQFDRTRRAAGVTGFSGQWNPQGAANLYWSASLLDRRYLAIAETLSAKPPSWLPILRSTSSQVEHSSPR